MIISVISSAHDVMEADSFVANVSHNVIPLLIARLGSRVNLLGLMALNGLFKIIASKMLIRLSLVFLNLVQRLLEDIEYLVLNIGSKLRVLTIKDLDRLVDCSLDIV